MSRPGAEAPKPKDPAASRGLAPAERMISALGRWFWRRSPPSVGRAGEFVAALLLRLKGYRVLARRFSIGAGTGAGEVDLIARRGRTLAFVEVKARESLDAAAEAIRPEQRRRIVRAAEAFLAKRPALGELKVRFDAVLVAPGRLPRHVSGAWRADD